LRYELRNGETVEILTHPQQRPSKDWLSFVRSGRARSKIRGFVRAEERARAKQVGRDVLERELKRYSMSLQKLLKDGRMQEVAQQSHHVSVDNLFVAVGYGRTTPGQVIEKLKPDTTPTTEEPSMLGQIFRKVARRQTTGGVVVQGLDDILVRYGKCCNPLPGDKVIGFVTRGRGVTVHRANCSRAIDVDPERRIDVSWDEKAIVSRPVSIRVLTADRPGILATISQVFTDNGVNITEANCKVSDTDRAVNTFQVGIKDAEQLRKVMNKIMAVRGVVGVERI